MNLFTKIAFIFFFAHSANIYSQDCDARIFISCDVENVNILIDDNLVGKSNLFESTVSMGLHRIVVLENSDRWDAKTFVDTVNVLNCDDIHLDYSFKTQLLLNTDPPDANVFTGDSLLGYTPLFIEPAINRFRLEKPGYETKSVSLSEIGLNDPVKLNFIGENNYESFIDKTLFKILAGSMLVLGAVTAYYKLEADNSFEDYEITGNPSSLDRTNKFDTISAITFAAFQINFGVIIYYFLVD